MHHSSIRAHLHDTPFGSLHAFLENRPLPSIEADTVKPPRKRRKITQKPVLKPHVDLVDEWQDALTLARVDIKLDVASIADSEIDTRSPERAFDATLPVYFCNTGHFRSGTFKPQLRSLSGDHLADIVLPPGVPSVTLEVLQHASRLIRPNKRSFAKAISIFNRTEPNDDSFRSECRLEIRIFWRNSRNLNDAHIDKQTHLLELCAPQGQNEAQEAWSPRDFYESLHVPDRTCNEAESINIDQLNCQLYPFQKRAVTWLLGREGVDIEGKEIQRRHEYQSSSDLANGFFTTKDADRRDCFISKALGIVTTAHEVLVEVGSRIQGGILAEEMGLGKTVEMIALICLHRRSLSVQHMGARSSLRGSSATLIITPPSILQQWMNEIQALAPNLKTMIYEGIKPEYLKMNDGDVVDRLLQHDIVLTTYHTLAAEIHYSDAPPDRSLRHEKKYERRRSPLVQIDWWRVVLDECQMIESGVSNAAKVAQLIPRQNAWAVSGTPLKKDAKDLLGLLIFLRCTPYCSYSASTWQQFVSKHRKTFRNIFAVLALRHTKEHVKMEIQLPAQKRVVLTVPFTQIEEQHYLNLYQQMCEDCGLDMEGHPITDAWDPEAVMEKMRVWLARLRQTCLHPEVGERNRRALGHNDGPLRTVGEVLEVMMEQNETATRLEERSLLLSQVRRGQILEHAKQSQEALQIWLLALAQSKAIVDDCRIQSSFGSENPKPAKSTSKLNEDQGSDVTAAHIGVLRLRLRSALEVLHTCTFFVANAYFQLKTNETITNLDSEQFRNLERVEEEYYENAKVLRKEMLTETYNKAEGLMSTIKSKAQTQYYVEIPNINSIDTLGGIESRNTLAKLEDLSDIMNKQAEQLDEWREKIIQLLLSPLVDQDDSDLHGNEYEDSTLQQDKIYVYVEALRALVADRHDALTGQSNTLIARDLNFALEQSREGSGHAPELFRQLLISRNNVKPRPQHGSLRGALTELRALKTNLQGLEGNANMRIASEIAIVNLALQNLHNDASKQAKVVAGLEKELDLFRDTMNARLEYYRQLQTISDAVAPYEEDLDEAALTNTLAEMKENETKVQSRIATLKSRARYLIHLRAESTSDDQPRLCIICQQSFEVGALTSCGHTYCKECFRLWFNAHRNCPTCKKPLTRNDLYSITYKPQELTAHEENIAKLSDSSSIPDIGSIYSGINDVTLNQIKNIDVEGSYGTKIDTIARHILWIRENDPGAKSIVFSQFKDFLDILARAFGRFKIGFTSIDKRGGIEKFKNDPGVECFFLHAKAHSSGLNLVNATHVFLCEPLINTAIELQAIARVHRIGQHHPTTVWMYLVENTVEKAIYDISVTRRLSHISRLSDRTTVKTGDSIENSIEAANAIELQEAPLSKLLTKGPSGGEMVEKEDLWNCLFNQKAAPRPQMPEEAEREVTRYLGAVVAEKRRA